MEKLARLRERAVKGGGDAAIERQHTRGKLTARERINVLLDPGSFEEVGQLKQHRHTELGLADMVYPGDAVVTGYGTINGRQVFVYSQDFTVIGGTLSEVAAEKICRIMDMAGKTGAPVIGINDSGGARIQEGIDSLYGYGTIFLRNVLFSGVVPQITLIMGPTAGGAVYSPALTDFIFMERGIGQMFVTGPDVVRAVTGEEVTLEDLGGADVHTSRSGVAHFAADGEEGTLKAARRLLEFLPQNNTEEAPFVDTGDPVTRTDDNLRALVPDNPNQPYDMKNVITSILDNGDFMEVQESWAMNVIIGFGRMGGQSVGIVAQQPMVMAGVLDIDAADKAARFIRTCDAFNVPVVTLIDVPGYMPGTDQEHRGIIRHGAKLIWAYAEASVPKISVITRKAYGGAYIVMSSIMLRGDIQYIWPQGEVAVMGADGAVNIIYREQIRKAQDQEAERARLIAQYKEMFANPYRAAQRGYVDDIIDPAVTRVKIIRALQMLRNKRDTMPPKKHGNIPL